MTMSGIRGNDATMTSWTLATKGASLGTVRHLAVGVGVVVLAVLAAWAGSAAPRGTVWVVALDVLVGLALIAAAALAPGPRAERRLVGGVGVAWLVGSFLLGARALHQAVLMVALLAFPSGRVHRGVRWVIGAPVVVAVGLGVLPQLSVGLLFGAIALLVLVADRQDHAARLYPALAAAGVAFALFLSWAAARASSGAIGPEAALVAYEAVLLAIAIGFPFAARAVVRARRRLADHVLADARLEGLEAIAMVLRPAVGDPDLQIYRWHEAVADYVDSDGSPVDIGARDRRWLTVADHGRPAAVVAHRSTVLDDEQTADAVTRVVRLAATHLRLRDEQNQQLRELEVSRARLVDAADRARVRLADGLRERVASSLGHARAELAALVTAAPGPRVADALDVVVGELNAAAREIDDLIANVPPTRLGAGRLREALDALVRRSPLPVRLTMTPDAIGETTAEAALFYVCSEALTNATKHAHASTIEVVLRRRDGAMVLAVTDDGRGGADPSGSGLQGLADRLAVHGGRLRIDSRPGAGTKVTATIPG